MSIDQSVPAASAPLPTLNIPPAEALSNDALVRKFVANVERLFNTDLSLITPEEHALWGIADETGELVNPFKKFYAYDSPVLDVENVIEEMGDLIFYVVAWLQSIGIDAKVIESTILRHVQATFTQIERRSSPITIINKIVDFRITTENSGFALLKDVCFLAELHNIKVSRILQANIAKLDNRYPAGFSSDAALLRADKTPQHANKKHAVDISDFE